MRRSLNPLFLGPFLLAVGLCQAAYAADKDTAKCQALAAKPGIQRDESSIQVKGPANPSEAKILVNGPVALYWEPEKLLSPTAKFCVKVPFKVRSPNPVLLGGSVYRPKEDGSLLLAIPWDESPTSILLSQIDDEGELHPEKFVLSGPSPTQLVEAANPKSASTDDQHLQWSLSAGVQPTYLNYDQTRLTEPYTATAITLKAGAGLTLGSKGNWSIDGGSYFTLAHITQSTNDSPRFLGGNLRLTSRVYTFDRTPGKPELRISVGPYYLTTLIQSERFGFANLGGFQILPSVRFTLPDQSVLSTYFKFSTVNEGFAFRSLENRELAFGVQWSPLRGWATPWSVSLDMSALASEVQTEEIRLQTYSIGVTYKFH